MKISPPALSLLATALLHRGGVRGQGEECLSGSFRLEIDGACNPTSILDAYEEQAYDVPGGIPKNCAVSAENDLLSKLDGRSIQSLCDDLYATQDKVPFTNAAGRGDDYLFEKMFFNGRTDWQEDVETGVSNAAIDVLKEDAENVRVFFDGIAQGRRVEWPGNISNFRSPADAADGGNGMSTCSTNAAMCCWPKDRQANDNNGNCATAYDENCVNKDPADNTDLCFVDLDRSISDGYVSGGNGYMGFPLDNNDGEGSVHCHGFAWSNDINDRTSRYRGNNLFFVSMYDHMYQRGYVKNIPGAPMCGCVEQMPTVTRSDCTQIDVVESFVVVYDSNARTFASKLTSVDVNFNACQGINNQNNNLWAYMARLYYQGDITPRQFGDAGRIITNGDCEGASYARLNDMNLRTGYEADARVWTLVAGRESMRRRDPYGNRAFGNSLRPSVAGAGPVHYGIVMRVCATCSIAHRRIYYRRNTVVPGDFNLLYNILYESTDGGGRNRWNVDFTLHSTYEDAMSGTNPWSCPGGVFNYAATFYGECSPSGTRVANQFSRFHEPSTWGSKTDVGYFVNKAEDDGLQLMTTAAIKGYSYWDANYGWQGMKASGIALRNATDGTIYMTGGGTDIWDTQDDFNYNYQAVSGDYTAIVHASGMMNPANDVWAKAGLMFRKSTAPNSTHYSVFLTLNSGVCAQTRKVENGISTSNCVQPGVKFAWLMIRKRGNAFTSHAGSQALPGGPIVWTLVHSDASVTAIGNDYNVGLAVTGHHWDAKIVTEAVFTGYQVVVSTDSPTTGPTSSRPTTSSPTTLNPTTRPTAPPTTSPSTRSPTTIPTATPTTRIPIATPTTRSPTTRIPTATATTRSPTRRPTTRSPSSRPSTGRPI